MTGAAQEMDALTRLRRDLRAAAKDLSQGEVRYLVDAYYQMQQDRIRSSAQVRALRDTDEPHLVIQWLAENTALIHHTTSDPIGIGERVVTFALQQQLDGQREHVRGHHEMLEDSPAP